MLRRSLIRKSISVVIQPESPQVARIVIKGPSPLNLMSAKFISDLHRSVEEINMNSAVRAAVIYGGHEAPSHFCAGLDLKEAAGQILVDDASRAMKTQKLQIMIERYQAAVHSLSLCRVPVIAAIHGHCIGGGINVATACDFRFCSAESIFSVREVAVGITADLGVLQRLGRIIGEGAARELSFTARDFNAETAKELRLVNKVLPDRQSVIDHAVVVATEIASKSPIAVQGTKIVMEHAFAGHTVEEGLRFTRMWNAGNLVSKDLLSAVTSFAAKKPPQFADTTLVNEPSQRL